MNYLNSLDSSTVLALGAAAVAAILILLISILGKQVFGKLTGKEDPSISYRPFSNIITFSILMVCVGCIATGLLMIGIGHSFNGVWVGMVGAVIWWAGDTDLPTKPRKAGALTLWGDFIKIGGKPVVVGGRTIIANWWPIRLDVEIFDMTTVSWDIIMIVYARGKGAGRDPVPRPIYGKVSVAIKADRDKLIELNQAGGIKNVKALSDDIIVREVRHLAFQEEAEDIVIDPKVLSDRLEQELTKRVKGAFDDRSFGVIIEKLQPHFDFSEDVRKTMEQNIKEEYERANELAEFKTDADAAKVLLQEYRDNGDDVKTFDQCVQEIKQLRLIRDEKVIYIATSGKGNTVFSELNIDMDGKKGKK